MAASPKSNRRNEQLAARAKLHRNYIGGVERGERNPTFKSVGKMLQVLGLGWSDLGRALDEMIQQDQ